MFKWPRFWGAVAGLIVLALIVLVIAPLLFPTPPGILGTDLQSIDELDRGLRHHGFAVGEHTRHRTALRLAALPISAVVGFGCYLWLRRREQ